MNAEKRSGACRPMMGDMRRYGVRPYGREVLLTSSLKNRVFYKRLNDNIL